MIPADAVLHIYEVRGDVGHGFADAPESFVGVWNEDDFAYLFFTSAEDDFVRRSVEGRGKPVGPAYVIAYRDWQAGTPYEDGRVGGIRVTPPDPLARPGPDTIILDPSVVFGDGSHPTTSSCLALLRRLIRSYAPASLLDLGAGTGILAIAAAAMGVRNVLAVDKNRLCVETTQENVRLNGRRRHIAVEEGDASHYIGRPYAAVAANLPYRVLYDLADSPLAGNHRMWLVSGVNPAQGAIIEELLVRRDYAVIHRLETPPWTTFAMVKTR